jgi:nitrite reductase/ring-hydroxylating ferredoxin subunit
VAKEYVACRNDESGMLVLTCPWHGSVFRLADGSVACGPATVTQPAFETREIGGAIQVWLPGAS